MIFGPKPKVVKNRFPKKMKKSVFGHALGEKIRGQRLLVVDEVKFDTPKTKIMALMLKSLNVSGRVLLVSDKTDRNMLLSGKNIPRLTCRSVRDVSAYDILSHDFLLLTKASFDSLRLGEP